jgi:hypothetical protein
MFVGRPEGAKELFRSDLGTLNEDATTGSATVGKLWWLSIEMKVLALTYPKHVS